MGNRIERDEKLLALAALVQRPRRTPSEGASLDELQAFLDGSLTDEDARRRVLSALANDPAAWRVWRAARQAPANPLPAAADRRESAPQPAKGWLAQLLRWIGPQAWAVPAFAVLILSVSVGVHLWTQDRAPIDGTLAALVEHQVPDLPQVAAALSGALAGLRSSVGTSKGLDGPSDDQSLGFDAGLLAAATALGVDRGALREPKPCTADCSVARLDGLEFGVWAFATLGRCAEPNQPDGLARSREDLPGLIDSHRQQLASGRLPMRLQPPPGVGAEGSQLCAYAEGIAVRILDRS